MAKGYWVARVDVSDPEGYKAYVAANAVAFAKYGAKFLVRGGRSESLEGTVKSFSSGPGVGRPTLVFSTSKGDRTVVLSPYRALMAAGFTPAEGAKLTIRMAPVTIDGTDEWVAISVSDPATGFTLALRDATTGRGLGGRGRS